MHVTYLVKLPASTVFSMKLALESSITFFALVLFHTFGFYFVYSINFILDFLDASAVYCISLSWNCNCNWRKENAAASIFGCDYCTAESTIVGAKRPQSISILNFPRTDSVYFISCLIFVQA